MVSFRRTRGSRNAEVAGPPVVDGDSSVSSQLEPQPSAMPPVLPPPVNAGAGGWPPDPPPVSQVVGSTVVPQIVVGDPSPSVEPAVIAPKYQALPFRPDVVIDGWSNEVATVRGVSQRGHLHRYNGAPRQDDFAIHQLPDGRVVVLVADGVSGALQSHLGASAAIKQGAEWLHSQLGPDLAETDWSALIKSTAWALTERAQTLLNLTEPDPVRAEEQLATTLVCAVIEPTGTGGLRAYLVGVGDSSAWLLLSSGRFVELLGAKAVTPDGMSSSTVAGLPRVPTHIAPVIAEIAIGEVLIVGTDGIGDPLGSGEGGVGNLLRDVLSGPGTPSLIEFAHAVDFSRETFDDDRTLVAVWPRKSTPARVGAHRRPPVPPDSPGELG